MLSLKHTSVVVLLPWPGVLMFAGMLALPACKSFVEPDAPADSMESIRKLASKEPMLDSTLWYTYAALRSRTALADVQIDADGLVSIIDSAYLRTDRGARPSKAKKVAANSYRSFLELFIDPKMVYQVKLDRMDSTIQGITLTGTVDVDVLDEARRYWISAKMDSLSNYKFLYRQLPDGIFGPLQGDRLGATGFVQRDSTDHLARKYQWIQKQASYATVHGGGLELCVHTYRRSGAVHALLPGVEQFVLQFGLFDYRAKE